MTATERAYVAGIIDGEGSIEYVQRNVIPMVIQSAMIGVSFKLGKRLLRTPLRKTNAGLKMALGAGIKL